jgi:hypothetical protein
MLATSEKCREATRPEASTSPVATVAAIPTVATVAALFAGELLRDGLERLVARNQLQKPRLLGLRLTRSYRQDDSALDVAFGVGLEYLTDRCAGGEQRAVEHAFGFLSTCGSPRPRAIGARAGELDFDPSGHSPPRYRLEDSSLH